jgi:hypothetical protein
MTSRFFQCLSFLFVVFIAFQIFFNLGSPRLWNDEAETAVYAQRILKYGIPKIHDGKNTIFPLSPWIHDGNIESLDAYVGSMWGQYYWAALGALIAETQKEDSGKTFWIRFPFAVIGFLGILFFVFALQECFSSKKLTHPAVPLFLFLIAFNTHLILHLREARYYSLIVFGFGLLLWFFLKMGEAQKSRYYTWFPCLIALLFNCFYPLAFLCLGYFFLWDCISYFKKKEKGSLAFYLSYGISGLMCAFFSYFYRISDTSASVKKIMTPNEYSVNFNQILDLFFQVDYLLPFLILSALYGIWRFKTKMPFSLSIKSFLFLTGFFIFYVGIASFSTVFFPRYVLVLHPCLSFAYAILIFEWGCCLRSSVSNKKVLLAMVFASILIFACHYKNILNTKFLLHSFQEKYQGPVDVTIDFIRKHWKNPETLIIATNIEEPCFIFYLKAKIIVGLTKTNLKEDMKLIPDLIIFRKHHNYDFGIPGTLSHSEIFNHYLNKASYQSTRFPIVDLQFNNFPALAGQTTHLFSTALTKNPDEMLTLLIRDTQ